MANPKKGKIHPKHLILEPNRADCSQEENIVFLKTHKTASSTIQNIFFRYGLKNSLRFALPEKGWKSHLLGYPSPFQRSFLQQERIQITCDQFRVNFGSFRGHSMTVIDWGSINPYWQIMENSSRNLSEVSIFRVVTKAVLLENSSIH